MRLVTRAIAIAALCCAAVAASAQETYRSEQDGWSVEVPAGWRPFEPNLTGGRSKFDAFSALATARRVLASRGCFTKAAKDGPNVPAIVTSFDSLDLSESTFDEVESDLNKSSGGGRWTGDRGRARLTSETSVDVQDVGHLSRTQVIFLGRHGVARVDLYCRAEESSAMRAEFDRVLDSFRWKPGYEYREPTFLDSVRWVQVGCGVAVVLVIALVRTVRSDVSDGDRRPKLRTRRLRRSRTSTDSRRP